MAGGLLLDVRNRGEDGETALKPPTRVEPYQLQALAFRADHVPAITPGLMGDRLHNVPCTSYIDIQSIAAGLRTTAAQLYRLWITRLL
jgi:hypothetical protein